MFAYLSRKLLFPLLPILYLLTAGACAQAGWLGLRNDLSNSVTVYTMADTKGNPRPSPARKLLPGEVAWDWVAENGPRTVVVQETMGTKTGVGRFRVELNQEKPLFAIQRVMKNGMAEIVLLPVQGAKKP